MDAAHEPHLTIGSGDRGDPALTIV